MRFMVLIKADRNSEAGVMPSEQLLADMGRFNEELVKAGVMQAGEGLHPSAKGARVRLSGQDREVSYGPFPYDAQRRADRAWVAAPGIPCAGTRPHQEVRSAGRGDSPFIEFMQAKNRDRPGY